LSRSRDNPRRLSYKCPGCGRFIRWAYLKDNSPILRRENAGNKGDYSSNGIRVLIQEVTDVKKITKEMNNIMVYVLMFVVTLVVLIAVKYIDEDRM